jgi:hypothetical protein
MHMALSTVKSVRTNKIIAHTLLPFVYFKTVNVLFLLY